MKNKFKLILPLFLVAVVALPLGGCYALGEYLIESAYYEEKGNYSTDNSQQEKPERVVYSDENVTITYLGVDDPYTGLTLFFMDLRIENNFDKNAFIVLSEGYINDTAISFLGGNATFEGIKPNKKAVCRFTFGYDGLGITKIEDIYKIEFKIKLVNPDDFSEVLLETDTITINFD